ncbi:hypothetical protein E2C01_086476 [Portunus trituberculatus]|uniref:Uncharacterized protein n=1 Tax=Portunus trituberculatus TaxID=210409 RepID=A0A5B7J9D8_PORTR|nr:hypothetical protein [Portunus trituberculatus]
MPVRSSTTTISSWFRTTSTTNPPVRSVRDFDLPKRERSNPDLALCGANLPIHLKETTTAHTEEVRGLERGL